MKLIHAACAIVAASLLPTATAFEPPSSTDEARGSLTRSCVKPGLVATTRAVTDNLTKRNV